MCANTSLCPASCGAPFECCLCRIEIQSAQPKARDGVSKEILCSGGKSPTKVLPTLRDQAASQASLTLGVEPSAPREHGDAKLDERQPLGAVTRTHGRWHALTDLTCRLKAQCPDIAMEGLRCIQNKVLESKLLTIASHVESFERHRKRANEQEDKVT
eukprot:3882774-Amphidinium_carterae.1